MQYVVTNFSEQCAGAIFMLVKLNIDGADCFQTSVTVYQATRCNNPGHHNSEPSHLEILHFYASHTFAIMYMAASLTRLLGKRLTFYE
jgi:hypothetical protein